jgi:hypothetical protein
LYVYDEHIIRIGQTNLENSICPLLCVRIHHCTRHYNKYKDRIEHIYVRAADDDNEDSSNNNNVTVVVCVGIAVHTYIYIYITRMYK